MEYKVGDTVQDTILGPAVLGTVVACRPSSYAEGRQLIVIHWDSTPYANVSDDGVYPSDSVFIKPYRVNQTYEEV